MDISVIVVTYNSANQIATCLQSVLKQTGVTFEVVVVDNASADTTLSQLANFDVRVIANQENLGFGRGNNLGFVTSCGRYIYLLNPDARLVEKNCLAELCRHMDASPRCGMAGTLVRSADGNSNNLSSTTYPGARHVRRDFSQLPGNIAWILGASMIIRRELYEKLGGFDPGFFLYSEETDLCLRMRELGFEIGYVPEVVVEHVGAASEDTRDPYDVALRKMKGLLRFRQKHYAADDCVRLARRDLWRARLRASCNCWLAVFQTTRASAWKKKRNYQAVRDVSRDYLARVKNARK